MLALGAAADDAEPLAPESADHYQTQIYPLLMETCGDCHHPEDDENPVRFLHAATRQEMTSERAIWHSVAEQLRNRTMPPADSTQPSDEDREKLASWIETTLTATACDSGPYAGQVVARRLNRQEYENTIRDLFGLTLGFNDRLPADGSGGEGFDNNGETLYLQPMLMERYLTAAQEVLDKAIVSPPVELSLKPSELIVEGRADGLLTDGRETSAAFSVYEVGTVRSEWTITAADPAAESASVMLLVDGVAVDRIPTKSLKPSEPIQFESRFERGLHTFGLMLEGSGSLTIGEVVVRQNRREPKNWEVDKHQRLLGIKPGRVPSGPRAKAEHRIRKLAEGAFRGPVEAATMRKLMSLYDQAERRGDPWEERCKLAMKAILVSPRFLFRSERTQTAAGGEPMHLLDDYALATRLSYFLTLAPPDDELRKVAAAGELRDPAVLRKQTHRLLKGPRSIEFARAFAGQWLGTHEIGGRKIPDTGTFLNQYSVHMLKSFKEEPVQFFDHLQRQDRPLTELITADYSILNDHLMMLYDVKKAPQGKNAQGDRGRYSPLEMHYRRKPDFDNERWRKVDLSERNRGGLLGMGGIHLATSYSDRTSPVLRGAWILETLVGIHVPNPPANVSTQLKKGKDGVPLSTREQLEMHRDNPSCAACHNLMDPLGFALDEFDVLSRPRKTETVDIGKKKDGSRNKKTFDIDTTATLPSGETIQGVAGLRQTLAGRSDEFRRHLTGKMLGFALGRSLSDRDDCTIDRITAALGEDATIEDLVQQIVSSVPFRYRSVSDDANAVAQR